MKRNAGCAVMIILGMLLAGCGNHTAAESTEMPEPDISSQEKNISMAAPADLGAIRQIHMENPSWEYYCATEPASLAAPLKLTKLTQEANQITDTDDWFEKNNLSLNVEDSGKYGLGIPSDENGGKCRIQVVDGEKGEVFELDFSDYEYAGDFKQSEKEFVRQQIRYAQVKDHILYLSIGHLTYAESSPHNAYVAAVDLAEKKLLWKSQPLVSNAANFVIKGDVLLCGYGFTAEPDYIYQLDLGSGKVIDKTAVKSKADYLILKDNILYVRTYNTDYTFRIE
ncbi:hypothetical protein [[Clostridium] symbiosum]|uniref:hypothetical protein n=1 Tax=Clostridium symbiosum TaxID=1512 RepID=UPI001FC7F03F|nr:hypothetical protein [[Clostridium] symbiosum]